MATTRARLHGFWHKLSRPFALSSSPSSAVGLQQGETPLTRTALVALVAVFLILFASRVYRLPDLDLEKDEAWSAWITLGSLQQTVEWTGYDWPPGHFILLHFWRLLTGITPFGFRLSTVLTMLVAAALLFAISRKLFGVKAGILSMLALGGLGYILFLSTILRGYMLVLTLFLLALWLTLQYFERPTPWQGLSIGVVLTLMFYIHNISLISIPILALFSLLLFRSPRRWLMLWLLPGVIVMALCIPYLISRLYIIGVKTEISEQYIPAAAPEVRLVNHYLDYFGQQPALFAALFVIATALILDRWRLRRHTIALMLWMLMPVALIWVVSSFDAFNARHLSWVMVGVALWLGWGLALLPRAAMLAAALVLACLNFDKIPLNERYETIPRLPFVTAFTALSRELRHGDVILTDLICRDCIPIDAEEWDYAVRSHFPNGLAFITPAQLKAAPAAYRRIWYVSTKGKETPEILATVEQHRGMISQIGPENFLFRLYEAPVDPVGVLFENGMRLHGAELLNDANLSLVWREGDTVKLRLFWSVDAPVEFDYSEGSYLWDREKGVIAQRDDPPLVLNGPSATSQWQPGQVYIEERTLKLAYPLTTGDYDIMLSLYQWWDGVRIPAPGVTADTLFKLGTIYVKAW